MTKHQASSVGKISKVAKLFFAFYIPVVLITFFFLGIYDIQFTYAQTPTTAGSAVTNTTSNTESSNTGYRPSCNNEVCKFVFLAPLPIQGIDTSGQLDLGGDGATRYIKGLYIFGVAVAAGLAVIMIVIGGIEMSTVDAMSGKIDGAGRKRINAALSGLALALLSYLILATLNQSLLNANFVPQKIDVDLAIGQGSGGNLTVTPGSSGSTYYPPDFVGPIPSNFSNADWATAARQLISQSSLPSTNPSDISRFFRDGQPSVENWVKLVGAIIQLESGFKPGLTYTESFTNQYGERVISTGLMQLSYASARGYGFSGITTQDLKDPYTNLKVGIRILEKWVVQDGCISCGNARGGGRYWSVMRPAGKLSQIINITNR